MLSFRYLVAALIGAMAVLPSAAYPEEHKKYGAVKNCREFWITLRTFYQCFYRRNLIIATGRLSN